MHLRQSESLGVSSWYVRGRPLPGVVTLQLRSHLHLDISRRAGYTTPWRRQIRPPLRTRTRSIRSRPYPGPRSSSTRSAVSVLSEVIMRPRYSHLWRKSRTTVRRTLAAHAPNARIRRAFAKLGDTTGPAGGAIASPGRSCEAVSGPEGRQKRRNDRPQDKKLAIAMLFSEPTPTRGDPGPFRLPFIATARSTSSREAATRSRRSNCRRRERRSSSTGGAARRREPTREPRGRRSRP